MLIHPHVLQDFLDYNDFLDEADRLLAELDLEGVLQVASFHPRYQFAGTGEDDIENYSNRSPYPMLHLLREASIALSTGGWLVMEIGYGQSTSIESEIAAVAGLTLVEVREDLQGIPRVVVARRDGAAG